MILIVFSSNIENLGQNEDFDKTLFSLIITNFEVHCRKLTKTTLKSCHYEKSTHNHLFGHDSFAYSIMQKGQLI